MRKLTTDGRFQVDELGEVHDFGPETRKKANAIAWSVSRETCTHDHTPYRASGGMPCTGPRVCTMCNTIATPTRSFIIEAR